MEVSRRTRIAGLGVAMAAAIGAQIATVTAGRGGRELTVRVAPGRLSDG